MINKTFSEPAPNEGMEKMAVGAAGIVVGLVFSLCGLLYYKVKYAGEDESYYLKTCLSKHSLNLCYLLLLFFLTVAHVLVPTTEVGGSI